ncbi:MAG: asparagine synthase (glutamine-hydrolyzing) [Lachnospiraceae bacterium]|nr:asparagine synthase (glutamine-hydrolyzing) [Lachnospiraceae bacterium]
MCGIAGIIKKKNGKVNREEIQMMNHVMAHRGPDAEGIYIDDTVGFGHRRLSIVDLSESGNQPMFSHDRKYMLVFNGEIYNYIELKEHLKKKGAKFVTETDTEVIMEAYRFWGMDCTKKFNGMWSFALYDTVKREVFFSRDRFGVKPLYIYESEDELVFASEIKCITAIRPEQKRANITQIARYLAGYQEDMDEHTFYTNIQNFLPSHSMLYDLDTDTGEYQQYWEINVPKFRKKWKCDNPYPKFLELLEDSIRIRLRADVKVGASLSGGLDSSTIVGILSKKFRAKIHTFSSIYKDKSCNEKEYIDCMNQYADTIPHYIYPDRSDNIVQDMQNMLYYHDGPCFSASPYSGYCVYRGVGEHVKVMLDGQGADELFGGYLFFYRAKLKEVLRQNSRIAKLRAVILIASIWKVYPDIARNLATELLRETPMDKKWRQLKKKMRRREQAQQHTRLKYRKKFAEIDLKIGAQDNYSIINELDKELNLQLQYRLLPRILHDVDRNSMARSLEVRLPFLDYRLVEFSYTLSDEDKIRGSYTKYIMRKSCKKYLPEKVRNRRNKMGFPAPFDKWLRDERFRDEIKKYLDAFKYRNIVDSFSLERCYQAHLSGKENWEEQLFRFMMLEMWLQTEIDTEHKKWVYEAG